jgi:regulator of protease activity HflC (stomatin/prohibitin superfamily)
MGVTISVQLRPDPEELYQLAIEIGPEYYERLVRPEFFTLTRNVTANFSHLDLPEKSPVIEEKILTSLRERLTGKHLEFYNVTLDHIMYSPLVTAASDKKLATKQLLEQKEFETGIAEKDAEIQRIRARGQRDAQKIIGEGLTKMYLQFKSLEVQQSLSSSDNSKFYFIPIGEDGLPIIIDTNVDVAKK